MGAIFLEDKLQEGVQDTFEFFKQSGIKVWMVTGDKTETALSVSKNSSLIDINSQIIELTMDNALSFHK